MNTNIQDLHGVPKTLLIPLACRAIESKRPDALLVDRQAAQVLEHFTGVNEFVMGMSEADQTFTMMRARQFDRYASAFLNKHPSGLVVDIGCGLDTRFNRLDNGQMGWLGLDLPEVMALRRQLLPQAERCRTIAGSMFALEWMDEVAQAGRPAIFLAEGVFPYFRPEQIQPMISAMGERFEGCELVFDALSTFSVWLHNRSRLVQQEPGVHLNWGVDDPKALESWGLHFIDQWGYFDQREPRLGLAFLMRYIPKLAKANAVLHFRLEKTH